MKPDESPILEVIVGSVADALAAKAGGAGRLEVVRNLELGGLTPSFQLVQEIKNAVDLPLRIMLRENIGFEAQDNDELESLCFAAEKFASLGVDGLVLGYLKDGIVDLTVCERILECAPKLNATFHHAFEAARDQFQAVNEIRLLRQVDRILSHGSADSLDEKLFRFEMYRLLAGPRIEIIAGGGIDIDAIGKIGRATKIREFHVGRAARSRNRVDGEVLAELVSQLAEQLKQLDP